MKAAYFDATGTPDVICVRDVPAPEPKEREIRVKVLAASINPIDTYIRSGAAPMPLPKPAITGTDFAGVVDAVGPDAKFKVGDRVWGSNQGLLGRQGTCAEFVCVEDKWAYPTPAEVADEQAAAAALVGITAHLGLFHRAKLTRGETVFVNGGTGGVGSMVVQMAKAVGANVICTVGSEEKAEIARELGADLALNYRTDDVAAWVKEYTGGGGVEVWYETLPPAGDFDKTIELTAPRGRIVVMAGRAARPVLPNGPFYVKGLSLLGFAMFNMTAEEQQVCAADMNAWFAAGKLKSLIGARFPLAKTAEAHQLQEDNTLRKTGTLTGKIVISPTG